MIDAHYTVPLNVTETCNYNYSCLALKQTVSLFDLLLPDTNTTTTTTIIIITVFPCDHHRHRHHITRGHCFFTGGCRFFFSPSYLLKKHHSLPANVLNSFIHHASTSISVHPDSSFHSGINTHCLSISPSHLTKSIMKMANILKGFIKLTQVMEARLELIGQHTPSQVNNGWGLVDIPAGPLPPYLSYLTYLSWLLPSLTSTLLCPPPFP